jgi:hypothetical protein
MSLAVAIGSTYRACGSVVVVASVSLVHLETHQLGQFDEKGGQLLPLL